jgi:hypothetical protein
MQHFLTLYFPFEQTGVAHHPAIMACLPSFVNMPPDSGYIGLKPTHTTRRTISLVITAPLTPIDPDYIR